ncbi:hypothetical protein [Streptomyces capillispiralis]|uniref:hypothetical protein n=1 Tax=Streptomyces capillispiralis TaxID=68182 RepID=UPI0011A04CFF|nr:hypothetical protein [Streptomyces capillispiralis]GHH91820.1 hypothetical protein GCM10017779_22770 [Streptomyces capillispiralis]
MIPETTGEPGSRRTETGWARARRLRGREPLRTCLPAVDRGTGSTPSNAGAEWNIVRGED